MKIALAALSCDNETGIGRIVRSLAREFAADAHDVTVVAHRITGLPGGIACVRLPSIPLSPALSRVAFRYQSRHLFAHSRFDVVNAFGVGSVAGVVSAQSCHAAAVKLQDSSRPGRIARKGLGVFDAAALKDEQVLMTSPATRRVIAVSRLVRDQLLETYDLPADNVRVIPNGVDLNGFDPPADDRARRELRTRLGFVEGEFGLLFIGNEFDRKGLQTVIEALALLRDRSVTLAVVGGDTPAPYRVLARRAGVESRIRFLGSIEAPERLLPAADALVLPAWYEPFGMVIIEAMAAGVPVIATASAGALEGLRHETHALFLNDPLSGSELAGQIGRLREDDVLRRRLASNGRSVAVRYSWSSVARETLAVYREAMGTAGLDS
ncbi:MAG: glycosyltransferase family 4 protein [Bacteroidota bacterium]